MLLILLFQPSFDFLTTDSYESIPLPKQKTFSHRLYAVACTQALCYFNEMNFYFPGIKNLRKFPAIAN